MDGHSSRSAVPPPGRPVTGQRMETVLGCFTAGSVATCWAGTLLVQSHLTGMVHCWFTHVLLDWFTTGSVTTYKNGSQLVVTIYRVSPLVQSQPAGLLHHWFSHNLLSWFITGSAAPYWAGLSLICIVVIHDLLLVTVDLYAFLLVCLFFTHLLLYIIVHRSLHVVCLLHIYFCI